MDKASLHPIIEAVHHRGQSIFSLHGWDLSIACSTEEGLYIETSVYQGEHFIPPSVRSAVDTQPNHNIHSFLPTLLRLDEEDSQVLLHYNGNATDLTMMRFNAVLEEFAWVAEQWWTYLNERSRGDLVYIHVKS